jgi:hypothetical protein
MESFYPSSHHGTSPVNPSPSPPFTWPFTLTLFFQTRNKRLIELLISSFSTSNIHNVDTQTKNTSTWHPKPRSRRNPRPPRALVLPGLLRYPNFHRLRSPTVPTMPQSLTSKLSTRRAMDRPLWSAFSQDTLQSRDHCTADQIQGSCQLGGTAPAVAVKNNKVSQTGMLEGGCLEPGCYWIR